MNKEQANQCSLRCLDVFHVRYPDSVSLPVSMEIIERERFIPRLVEIETSYTSGNSQLIEQSFASCDAATIRKPDTNHVVISYVSEDAEVLIAIRTYHELAHIYCMAAQEAEHPLNEERLKGDALVGFMFWIEFIADYVGLDTLHRSINSRFAADSQDAKEYIGQNMRNIGVEYYPGNSHVISPLANVFAFILNLEDYTHNRIKVKIPINARSAAGKKVRSYLDQMLDELEKQLNSDNYIVVCEDSLHVIGSVTIDILLYLSDYAEEHDW
ncbi:hypothetical protein AGMMS49992_34100 [Clostridia bacterium]|nr:hypothetical protein AGMMS49992_34100 [Clostridia bacterium]